MPERVDTVVVGAGQAGLSVSYHLTLRGREHVVLERGRVGETWRSQRWDAFFLNTPKWSQQLPGYEYDGPSPDDFAPLEEVVEYVEGYAESFRAPVRENVEVTALRPAGGGYVLETNDSTLSTAHVVVATGAFQQPAPEAPGADSAAVELQLRTSDYRRPAQLPEGAVLIVGSGQSGCQIANELMQAGRTVYIATGRCPWFPRRYRGRDITAWAIDLGLTDQTVDSLPSPAARLACNPPVSGNDGGHDCHPRWLQRRGAQVVGRVRSVDGAHVALEPGLEQNLAGGDEFVEDIRGRVDAYVAAHELDVPPPDPSESWQPLPDTEELHLRRTGITTILWAAGFRPDYRWIDLPVTDEYGWPVQRRGVADHPDLYFVGVHWLHKRKSALLFGVGEDAEHVVEHLCSSA